MSERFSAWIETGGQVDRSRIAPLLKSINASFVKLDWGEPDFAPSSADELVNACVDGRLQLCDEEARYGEFTELEEACRLLGLSYTRRSEGFCGYDAEIVDWRPGMEKPLVRIGSNENCETVFVAAKKVKEVLVALEGGQYRDAAEKLRALCPDIPELPPFEIT